MALKDYPDWVLKHKQKGAEIRYIRNKYYLYTYHYEKVNGKNKKITNGYLGCITPEGLIAPIVKKDKYFVKEYSSTVFIFHVASKIIKSITERFPSNFNIILSNVFFNKIFNSNLKKYNSSYLSILFPITNKSINKKMQEEITRVSSMLDYHLEKFLQNNTLTSFLDSINDLYIICVKNTWILAQTSDDTLNILNQNKISLEVSYGKTN